MKIHYVYKWNVEDRKMPQSLRVQLASSLLTLIRTALELYKYTTIFGTMTSCGIRIFQTLTARSHWQ